MQSRNATRQARVRRARPLRIAVLVALTSVVSLASAACREGPPPSASPPRDGDKANVKQNETAIAPAALYEDWGCSACHGSDRRGTENAPPLASLDPSWRVDTLADYLHRPETWRASNPRVLELTKRYPNVEMPALDAPEAERRAVATWLLDGGSR